MTYTLTDNLNWKSLSDLGLEHCAPDLEMIANCNVSDLIAGDNANLLIFPQCLGEYGDDIGEGHILSLSNGYISTGNIMGFVGVNNTMLSIKSRFAQKNEEDYFLHYMLQRVFNINLFDLKHATSSEPVFDFLLYLFPFYLKKALRQGLLKKYQRFQHNDSRIRGTISVSRHIRLNIPFKGNVAYETKEQSYDNEITQLIRHTIEHISTKTSGRRILRNDAETIGCVSQIVNATPTYTKNNRSRVIIANLRPLVHPYFSEYTMLQHICVQILRHEFIKYGQDNEKVYGVLFDGAWLWEEYLNTILQNIGFHHPRNKDSEGGIRMFASPKKGENFDKNNRRIYPDFYKENFILDAKYKHLNGNVGREDLYQVVSYMYCMDASYGGFVYPDDGNHSVATYKLAGNAGGIMKVIPVAIPQECDNWNNFQLLLNQNETKLKETLLS